MIKKTSQRNYAKTEGIYCPFCRNSNTYALGSFYTFENSAFEELNVVVVEEDGKINISL